MHHYQEGDIRLIPDNYSSLKHVYQMALDHASIGKGHVRHATDKPFEDQISGAITNLVGIGYPLGQALKKHDESKRLLKHQAIAELLGAINYLALAVIKLEKNG